LPEINKPVAFKTIAGSADAERLLVFCDEDAEVKDPVAALAAARPQATALLPAEAVRHAVSLAVLIGPEGGFAEDEREALSKLPNVVRLALGPRILRADTAAVAALALVQAVLGDWRGG
jgi:16S rRNA (uracil1498-N3)-methyltransferase